MGFKKGKELELEIIDIVFGGKGLAKVDGFAIFVDKTVTGDRVLARITKKKKSFAEARVVEFIEKAESRVDPVCDYSGYCGGCKWQFLDYQEQLKHKTGHVKDSLTHIGMLPDVPVLPTLPSELVFGYRNKMEFSCTDKRWLMPEELNDPDVKKGFGLGLHVPGTFHNVVDISDCHIQPAMGNQILSDVREYIVSSGVPAYGLKSHEGFWRFVMLRHSVAHDQWMVNIVTSSENRKVVDPLAQMLMEKYPEVVSIVNNITSRRAGVSVGEYEILLAGERCIKDKLGDFEFEISANSFFQTNTRGAETLYSKVKEYAALTGNETVLDLYSGTGTIPIWLSGSAKEILGIEIVESSVKDAGMNCKRNGVSNCRFILGDIKDVLPTLDKKPEVMIIDPPRAGMHKDVVKQVLALAPGRLVYVSCNPSTLARDLEMMKEKYDVEEVQPVDMFPHTFHIESVAKLTLKKS